MQKILQSYQIDTPLGVMTVIADTEELYLLEFTDRQALTQEIERLRSKISSNITTGSNSILRSIETELKSYFEGKLKQFKTPVHLVGTSFQKLAWSELMRIPYGTTHSYAKQAIEIGKQAAYRAVANANGSNQLSIIVPCHRIINSNGKLGGYGGGIARKKWLIEHEKRHSLFKDIRT